MSKTGDDFIRNLLSESWLAPDGRTYIADRSSHNSPEYLIDLEKLIDYFRNVDTVNLIIATQRLVIDFVSETARPQDIDGYLPHAIYDKINDVSFFADTLEECIKRDATLIDAYKQYIKQREGRGEP